jgi:hypothetical protein
VEWYLCETKSAVEPAAWRFSFPENTAGGEPALEIDVVGGDRSSETDVRRTEDDWSTGGLELIHLLNKKTNKPVKNART